MTQHILLIYSHLSMDQVREVCDGRDYFSSFVSSRPRRRCLLWTI